MIRIIAERIMIVNLIISLRISTYELVVENDQFILKYSTTKLDMSISLKIMEIKLNQKVQSIQIYFFNT